MNNLQSLRPLLHLQKPQEKPYRYLTPQSLLIHGGLLTTASKVGALFRHQKLHFEMLQSGLLKLQDVRFRRIHLPDGSEAVIELNERRMRNTSDHRKDVAHGRPCFLCSVNQDPHERALYYDADVSILTNPNPVLPAHIVISYNSHQPQSFLALSNDAFAIAKELHKSHFVFFNGVSMGASAPDHAHLQAADRSDLPFEQYVHRLKQQPSATHILYQHAANQIYTIKDISRGVIIIESDNSAKARELTAIVLAAIDNPHATKCNVVLTYQDHVYRVYVFPRSAFRPVFFSADPESIDHVGISPAAVELMGIVITPFLKDFVTLTAEITDRIYAQTCMPSSVIISRLTKMFDISDH